jgi:hypothetical protein
MNNYQFTVTEYVDLTMMELYYVDIECENMMATGHITKYKDTLNLVDIKFDSPIGIHRLHDFVTGLYNQQVDLLPSVVKEYNERLLTASA